VIFSILVLVFSDVMKSFLLYLDEDGVGDFIQQIDFYVEHPENLNIKYPDFFWPIEER